jgi:hypothetical protein
MAGCAFNQAVQKFHKGWGFFCLQSSPGPPIPGGFDGVLAEGTISKDDLEGPLRGASLETLIALMQHGDTYVNVHTKDSPTGEIRGQIQNSSPANFGQMNKKAWSTVIPAI